MRATARRDDLGREAADLRRRALRALLIMALASSPLIWVKLRLVTGIPRMAYATEAADGAADAQESAAARESMVAQLD